MVNKITKSLPVYDVALRKVVIISFTTLSLISLVTSNCLPFLYTELNLRMPFWLPIYLAVKVQNWIIAYGNISIGPQYLLVIIRNLFLSGDIFIGSAILVFSFFLPLVKILLVLLIASIGDNLEETIQKRWTSGLLSISRWSMADVFIVGLCIVFFKAEGFHFHFSAGAGLYFYVSSAIFSAISSFLIPKYNRARRNI